MKTVILGENDECIDLDCEETPALDLPGMRGETSVRVQELFAVQTSEAGRELTEETAGTAAACLTCDGKGIMPKGRDRANSDDNLCPDCGGHGYPGISADDPLPEFGGPDRVPYFHVRYHCGRPLFD